MKNFEIIPIPAFKDNYIWAVINEKSQSALIVDPGEPQPVIDFLTQKSLKLDTILITHHHADHRGGIKILKEKYSPVIYAPLHKEIESPSFLVDDIPEIQTENFGAFKVLKIPGHTLEHVAYYQDNPIKILFCGDTLFSAGCGRVFEGTYEQMYSSLKLLNQLPSDTNIYCAHEYTLSNLLFSKAVEPSNLDVKNLITITEKKMEKNIPSLPSTLAIERGINPFLRCTEKEVINSAEIYANKKLLDEVSIFESLRKWKNEFKI